MTTPRRVEGDWYNGEIPANVTLAGSAYLETSYSFICHRSLRENAVCIGHGASVYEATMFDLGVNGRVTIGNYALLNGVRLICDAEVMIGEYSLLSWNVVIMDSYRMAANGAARRSELTAIAARRHLVASVDRPPQPVRIEANVWIGFDSCILPGVTIGEGAIIGARSVVTGNIPAFSIAAGNPAKVIRRIADHASP